MTSLKRVDESENYGDQERPAEVNERMVETAFTQLVAIAQDALEEFAWAVENEPSGVEIVGLTVVGSFLTEEFKPHQSDLDIYLLTDEEYEHENGFCRMLLDPTSAYRNQLYDVISREVSYVDPLGLSVIGAHRNFIRNPSITLKKDSNATESHECSVEQ